jgi:hypothetical protein
MKENFYQDVTPVSDEEVARILLAARRERSDLMAEGLRRLGRWLRGRGRERAPIVAGPLRTC